MDAIALHDVIAHRAPMLFLDRMLAIGADEAVAETIVTPANPLFVPGRGLPAYTGLEMMAQAIATIDGFKRNASGEGAKIGFLLGCRRYTVDREVFAEGTKLRIAAKMVFGDGEMFAFECRIDGEGGEEIARANMSVYAPKDPDKFLREGAP